jgi:hypothetical protein
MNKIKFTSEKRETFAGWSRNCRLNGVDYSVSVKRGKAVRIAFKPRGKNRGWHWHGAVYSNGRCVWSGRVPGSIGVRGLLHEAAAALNYQYVRRPTGR